LTFCDFKKMMIQKLLNRVEKYRYFCGQPDIKASDFSSIYFIML
jgi:hypothetical protein